MDLVTLRRSITLALNDLLAREGIRGHVRFRNSAITPSQRQALVDLYGEEDAQALADGFTGLVGLEARWQLEDDEAARGGICLPDIDGLIHGWQQDDPGHGFAAGVRFRVLDRAVDEAMAFVIAEGDGHTVVFARAGEEADAGPVAGSIRAYLERAAERGFVQYWPLSGQHLAGGVTPAEVLARVRVLPYRRDIRLTFDEVTPLVGAATLGWWCAQMLPIRVQRLAADLGVDPSPAAIEEKLGGKGRIPWKKVASWVGLSGSAVMKAPELQKALTFTEPHVGVRWSAPHAPGQPHRAASMLLDAPGSDALRAALGDAVTVVRIDPDWRTPAALVPLESAEGGLPPGPCRGAFVIPARLLPSDVVAGATLETFVSPWARQDD